MRASTLALVLTAVLVAGCGSSKKAAPPNGEASKPAARVLADAIAAAKSANSAHVSGSIDAGGTPITVDLTTVRGKGAKGSASTNGLAFDVVRIDDTIYIRGSDAFLKHFAGAAAAQLFHGKWLKASAMQRPVKSLAALTGLGALLAHIGSYHGTIINDGKTTYQGQSVVALRDANNGKFYVSATGKPYPVAVVGGTRGATGAITFSDWNEPVSLSAPSGAIDISHLLG